ncbi:MAG: AraC family transcriptional regulator [Bosea sp.]|nr:AraC family transcriptional regulator [Bosea sp. (in: a-proteobacteria)]
MDNPLAGHPKTSEAAREADEAAGDVIASEGASAGAASSGAASADVASAGAASADVLGDVVRLLQPRAPLGKLVSGAGAWRVERPASCQPFYAVVMDGAVRLTAERQAPLELTRGDFVLIPAVCGFAVASLDASGPPLGADAVHCLDGEMRHGDPDAPPNARLLVGHFDFASPDAALLVSLLPEIIHVTGEERLATLVALVNDEARKKRPAREVVLERLMEVLLIEALRASSGPSAPPGLLRGLADPRLAPVLRALHERPAEPWSVAALAREAALSRSAFFDRFTRTLGLAPMEYLLAWRMALAKNLLRREAAGVAEIAARVGYGSASAFTTAFTRVVGVSPVRFGRG